MNLRKGTEINHCNIKFIILIKTYGSEYQGLQGQDKAACMYAF